MGTRTIAMARTTLQAAELKLDEMSDRYAQSNVNNVEDLHDQFGKLLNELRNVVHATRIVAEHVG